MDHDDTFACPICDRQYRYKPELEGKSVRCKCGEKFIVEAPVAGDEPDAYELDQNMPEDDGPDWSALLGSTGDAPPPVQAANSVCPSCGSSVAQEAAICVQCGVDLRSGKKRGKTVIAQPSETAHETTTSAVRTKITGVGLLIHGLGYLGMMAGIALFFIGSWQTAKGSPLGDTLLMIAGISFIAGLPMLVLGPFLCLAVPKEAGLMYLIGAIALYILSVGTIVAFAFEMIPEFLQNLVVIPQVFAAGCFVMFMRELAEYLNAGSVYENTDFLLNTWKVIALTTGLLFVPCVGCLVVIVWLCAQLVFTLTYGWIVVQTALAAIRS